MQPDADESPEEVIDDEKLMAALSQYMEQKYGDKGILEGDDGSDEEEEVEEFRCTLCNNRPFYSEDDIEAHLSSKGHVEREVLFLIKEKERMAKQLKDVSRAGLGRRSQKKFKKSKDKAEKQEKSETKSDGKKDGKQKKKPSAAAAAAATPIAAIGSTDALKQKEKTKKTKKDAKPRQ